MQGTRRAVDELQLLLQCRQWPANAVHPSRHQLLRTQESRRRGQYGEVRGALRPAESAGSAVEVFKHYLPEPELWRVNQKVKRARYWRGPRMRMFLGRFRRFSELGRIHEDARRLRIVRHGLGTELRL